MSNLTPRFGLNFFGGTVSGALTDDGEKYTSSDRLSLDRILSGLEAATGHVQVVDTSQPDRPGQLTLAVGTGGALPAGRTFYYRAAFVDSTGLESPAGSEVSISTPDILQPPSTPFIREPAGMTGELGQGLHYYALTSLSDATSNPDQSVLGPVAAATLGPDVTALYVDMPQTLPTGAALAAIWRMGPNESGFTRIGTALAGDTYTDQGQIPANPNACDISQMPPLTNDGVSRYTVTVTLASADQPYLTSLNRSIKAWRFYRADSAGAYTGNSLVAEVIASTADPLPISWIDEGNGLATGSPTDVDQRLKLQPYVFDHADALPPVGAVPAFYPIVVGETLYAKINGAWVPVTGAGGGGGTPASTIMTAPDGGRWRLSVDNDGVLSTSPTPEPGPPSPPQAIA